MLVLFETPAGFALFKVLDEGKLKKPDDLWKEFQNVESAKKVVALKDFLKFENTTEALVACTAMVESKVSKSLKKFLKESIVSRQIKDELAVADAKLGGTIKEKLGIKVVHDSVINELLRGIRSQVHNLVAGLGETDLNAMALGLSHSLSRYKLKFSPDKVDTMIVQAISLLDDLDKELNTYAMRVKEWYGWHFPELVKIIPDNLLYARLVKKLGMRQTATKKSLQDVLPEETEHEVKEASIISMGTEISDEDLENICMLCDQVISIGEYREQLSEYLKNRMRAIAPNLTVLVGELVGARLISHAGSLMSLAKYPASTIQILGAEKALFRALKTKHATPKYGLIYHASLIGQTGAKNKGKMSRLIAAKAALSVRVDAMGETKEPTVGLEGLKKAEARLRQLEGKTAVAPDAKANAKLQQKGKLKKHERGASAGSEGGAGYNTASDMTLGIEKMEVVEPEGNGKKEKKDKEAKKKEKKEKKEARRAAKKAEAEAAAAAAAAAAAEAEGKSKKKRKREDDDDGEKKKKKKRKTQQE